MIKINTLNKYEIEGTIEGSKKDLTFEMLVLLEELDNLGINTFELLWQYRNYIKNKKEKEKENRVG